jgi:uncharacterized protein involved in response to NO
MQERIAERPSGGTDAAVPALGFRPFYLCAGVLATCWIPLWLAVVHGAWSGPTYLPAVVWHGHEMIYGYVLAVMAGFLLTAVRNWTGQQTPTGGPLAALVLLWLAGRAALLLGGQLPGWLIATVDVAFLPVLAIVLWVPLWRARNRRNMAFPALLLVLAAANARVHLAALGVGVVDSARALGLALDVITLIMVVVGGRVIPAFTANALPEARVRSWRALDRLAVLSVLLLLGVHLLSAPAVVTVPVALLAALANGMRMMGWGTRATWGTPILWILHAGYAWIVISLMLETLSVAGIAALRPFAVHALTVGAIGSLTLGMMTRSALGHTGRTLAATPAIVLAYACVNLAALVRSLVPIPFPHAYMSALGVSGLLWSLAFGVFTVVFWPVLTRPRIDGKPG